jgi:hypothetical protein
MFQALTSGYPQTPKSVVQNALEVLEPMETLRMSAAIMGPSRATAPSQTSSACTYVCYHGGQGKYFPYEANLGKFANTLNHLDKSAITEEGENFECAKERLRHG